MKFPTKFSTQHFGTNAEVQIRFGMKPLTDEQIKQAQDISLEIYKDILSVCNKYHLTVMLGGGSVLGAVRHKGFIPWDDDMDLMMPRKDYDEFVQLVDTTLSAKYDISIKSELPGLILRIEKKNTKMIGVFNNPKYSTGIGVDLTPIDSVPNNAIIYYLKGILTMCLFSVIISRRMYLRRTQLSREYYSQTLSMQLFYHIRMFIGFLSGIIPYKTMWRWYDRFIASSKKTDNVSIASGRKHYFGETLPTEVFYPVKQTKFEGVTAYVPNDYNKYLTNLYGDYMTIPPVNQREHHNVVEFIV